MAGFLAAEGVIGDARDLATMRYCADTHEQNTLDVVLAPDVPPPDDSMTRAFTTTSACGVCGKSSIEALRADRPYEVAADQVRLAPETLAARPTGCARRSGSSTGRAASTRPGSSTRTAGCCALRENVGRHNAVDKVIGWALRQGGCRSPEPCSW